MACKNIKVQANIKVEVEIEVEVEVKATLFFLRENSQILSRVVFDFVSYEFSSVMIVIKQAGFYGN